MPAFGEMMEITKKTTIDELNARYAELAVARGIDALAPTDRKALIAEINRLEAIPALFDEDLADGEPAAPNDEQPADLEPAAPNDEQPTDLEPATPHDLQSAPAVADLKDEPQVDEELVKIHPLCTIRAEYAGVSYEVLADQASALVPKIMADDLVNGGYATLLDV